SPPHSWRQPSPPGCADSSVPGARRPDRGMISAHPSPGRPPARRRPAGPPAGFLGINPQIKEETMVASRTSRARRGRLSAVAVAVLAAAVLPGAAAAATFRVAIGIDPDTLDPVQTTTTTVANVLDYMVETLTFLDPKGEVRPMLAESWTMSADGTQYTL